MQMADELKNLETLIIRELVAAYRHPTVDELVAQRDGDLRRLAGESSVMHTPEEIRDRLRALLIVSIEVMADRHEDHAWSAGLEGAVLKGRMSVLREILDWLTNGRGS